MQNNCHSEMIIMNFIKKKDSWTLSCYGTHNIKSIEKSKQKNEEKNEAFYDDEFHKLLSTK